MNEMTKLDIKDNKSLFDLEKEILYISDEIPFGNSDFQNRMASVNGEMSPHRALRASCLRIMDRIQALRECYFSLKEKEIEIKKLERDYEKQEDDLEKELIKIKIERTMSGMAYTQKLIKDAIREIESLYPIVKSIGKMTREEFESYEREHFKKKYELAINGANEVLIGWSQFQQEKDLYDQILTNKMIENKGESNEAK